MGICSNDLGNSRSDNSFRNSGRLNGKARQGGGVAVPHVRHSQPFSERSRSDFFGFPDECTPLIFIRPLSGSGALSVYDSIIAQYGADSFAGRVASTMMGSTEKIGRAHV